MPLDLAEIAWRITNDGVMGGLSRSAVHTADGTLVFDGELSRENNGGFASVLGALDAATQPHGLATTAGMAGESGVINKASVPGEALRRMCVREAALNVATLSPTDTMTMTLGPTPVKQPEPGSTIYFLASPLGEG